VRGTALAGTRCVTCERQLRGATGDDGHEHKQEETNVRAIFVV
jgi:hypothetical protein